MSMQPTGKISYTTILGHILQKQREFRGWHQVYVASHAGLSQSAYSRIEQGLTETSVEQLRAIAEVFGFSVVQILNEAEKVVLNLNAQGVVVTREKNVAQNDAKVALGFLAIALVGIAAIAAGS